MCPVASSGKLVECLQSVPELVIVSLTPNNEGLESFLYLLQLFEISFPNLS